MAAAPALWIVAIAGMALMAQTASSDESRSGITNTITTLPNEGWAMDKGGYTATLKAADSRPRASGKITPPTFHPAFVEFDRQPLCNPGQEVVTLVNNDPSQSLKLFGISTKSDDVHCTWFDMEDVAPGENTSFQVVHLGKSIGRVEASLTLSTSFGDLSYQVYANSVLSAMRARPLSNGRVPVGVMYTQPITVFNPLDSPLSVLEIYTSNDLLHLEPTESLTTGGYAGNENWQIGPRESKSVMQLRTTGEAPGLVQGYVHVLTNVSEADMVISVRVEVLEKQGLYHGPGDSIDFGALTTTDSPQIREIIILSNTDQVLRILNAEVDECTNLFGDATSCPDFKIELKRMNGLMEPNQFTVVGDATLTPSSKQPAGYFSGFITIDYSNLEDDTFQLKIPILAHILKGALQFPGLDSAFYIGEPPFEKATHTITVENQFEEGVMITDIVVPEELGSMFWIEEFKTLTIEPNSTGTFLLSFLPNSTDLLVDSSIELVANASTQPYGLSIFSYNGNLNYVVGEDEDAMDFGQINLGEQYTRTLAITNTNPIEIPLLYFFSELDAIAVLFDEIVTDDSMAALAEYGQLHPHNPKYAPVDIPEDADELEIVLQPGHTAKFTVNVETDSKSRVQGEVQFGSPYQVLHVPVHYRANKHSLVISPKSITFAPVFPGQLLDPARRKSSEIKHLIPLEQKSISMKPKDRLNDITNVYSDDPRLIIKRVNIDGAEPNSVTLAMVSLDPTMCAYIDNYAPQIYSTDGTLGELTEDIVTEVSRAQAAWKRIRKKKKTQVTAKIFIDSTSAKTDTIEVKGTLQPLQLNLPPSVNFPLTQIRHVTREEVTIVNPSQFPVLMSIVTPNDLSDDEAMLNSLVELFDLSPGDADPSDASPSSINATFDQDGGTVATVGPYGEMSLTLEFRPQTAGSLSSTLFLRNNLTAIQALPVTGEAGRGTFGFPKSQPYIVDGGLLLSLSSQNLSYCRLSRRMSVDDAARTFHFNVTVVNRGNMPVKVDRMGFAGSANGSSCTSAGFTVENCKPFTLRPKRPKMLTIAFQPEFTTSYLKQTLVVNLEGLDRPLNFNLVAKLPKESVRACFDSLPGPEWEGKFKGSVIISVLTIGALIFAYEYTQGTWKNGKKRAAARKVKSKAESKAEWEEAPRVAEVEKAEEISKTAQKALALQEALELEREAAAAAAKAAKAAKRGKKVEPPKPADPQTSGGDKPAAAKKPETVKEPKRATPPPPPRATPPPAAPPLEQPAKPAEGKKKKEKAVAVTVPAACAPKVKEPSPEQPVSKKDEKKKAKREEKTAAAAAAAVTPVPKAKKSPAPKTSQMPKVEKPEDLIAEAQARALASNGAGVAAKSAGTTGGFGLPEPVPIDESVVPPRLSAGSGVEFFRNMAPPFANAGSSTLHPVPQLGEKQGTVLSADTFSGFDSQASLWENVDATLASDAGSGLLSTPFGSGLDGADWASNLLSPSDFGGSAGTNSLLGPYESKGSGPTPPMQRGSSGSRPPGLGGGPPGLIAPSLQSELNSFAGSDPSSLWGDSSAFQPAPGSTNTNTNPSPGLPDVGSFSSGNSPTLARSNHKGASNQPPPGLGGGWGAFGDDAQSSPTNPNNATSTSDPFAAFGAGDAFNSGDGSGHANAGPPFSSLGDLPSIPYSNDTGIWGASEGGTFGDLDWAKPEEKKMTADTAEWTPGGW